MYIMGEILNLYVNAVCKFIVMYNTIHYIPSNISPVNRLVVNVKRINFLQITVTCIVLHDAFHIINV